MTHEKVMFDTDCLIRRRKCIGRLLAPDTLHSPDYDSSSSIQKCTRTSICTGPAYEPTWREKEIQLQNHFKGKADLHLFTVLRCLFEVNKVLLFNIE